MVHLLRLLVRTCCQTAFGNLARSCGSPSFSFSFSFPLLLAMGTVMHASEGDIVCRSTNEKIPYFNAPIFLENKSQVGKVDEILGPVNEVVQTSSFFLFSFFSFLFCSVLLLLSFFLLFFFFFFLLLLAVLHCQASNWCCCDFLQGA